MGIVLRLLALIGVIATASAVTSYFMKKGAHKSTDCKTLLAENRKELIKKMNKDIEDVEKRTSPENHEKIQKELNNVDWQENESCD